jgi:hypothetical protein
LDYERARDRLRFRRALRTHKRSIWNRTWRHERHQIAKPAGGNHGYMMFNMENSARYGCSAINER